MKVLDYNTSAHFGVPELVLMEQAATAFVDAFLKLSISGNGIIFCGTGNNGADGLAIARLLTERNVSVDICMIKDIWQIDAPTSNAYNIQKGICDTYQFSVLKEKGSLSAKKYDFVIDAVFGIGLSRTLSDEYADIIETMNQIDAIHIGVDIPSGVHADNGQIMGTAVKCDYTITFSYDKLGLNLWPGTDYAGKIIIAPIGITNKSWLDKRPSFAVLEETDMQKVSTRQAHSNKGTYGKLLIIAGGKDMAGAAILSARAAYRNGVGIVKVLTMEANRNAICSAVPEAVVVTYESAFDYNALQQMLLWADAVVIGPGFGTTDLSKDILTFVADNATTPVLFDADALNIMAVDTSIFDKKHENWIITPHLGEFSRLTNHGIEWIQKNLAEEALEFAREHDVICVLKDFHTVTANPYGLSYLNLSGNHGMATAGSGDVLSGIIGTFLAQGLKPIKAAAYGVFLHGCAGDKARVRASAHAMMASDIVEALQEVWNKMENE